MKIAELKRQNLERICAEYKVSRGDLMEMLNASKQHVGQLLNGSSGIGDKTIEVICEKLTIDELEFVRQDQPKIAVDNPDIKSYTNTPLSEDVEHAPIHEQIDYILEYGGDDSVNALKYGIQGVLKVIGETGESVLLLRKLCEKMDKLLELKTDVGEASSPPLSEQSNGGQKKNAL